MFADGTIAIVRTKTYHVELIDRAGHRRDVALPHDWILLSAADKQAAMDTLRNAATQVVITLEARNSAGQVISDGTGARDTATILTRLSEIPDTVPPISRFSQIAADADGHLWIETVIVRTNPYRYVEGAHFDVIDNDGRLVRRVVLPSDARLKAFTPGKVYYTAREGERTRLFIARTH
jgi:hypothetical protein